MSPAPYPFACGLCGHQPRDAAEHGLHIVEAHLGWLVDANAAVPSNRAHEELEAAEVYPK